MAEFVACMDGTATYRCAVCGNSYTSDHGIIQCDICLMSLCNECNYFGLCRQHYAMLSTEDQIQIKGFALDSRGFVFVLGVFVVMGSGILFAVASLAIFSPWMVMFSLLGVIAMMINLKCNSQQKRKIRQLILAKYDFNNDIHRSGQQAIKSKQMSSQIKYCFFCGMIVDSSPRFCGGCGQKLVDD